MLAFFGLRRNCKMERRNFMGDGVLEYSRIDTNVDGGDFKKTFGKKNIEIQDAGNAPAQ